MSLGGYNGNKSQTGPTDRDKGHQNRPGSHSPDPQTNPTRS